MDTKNLCAFNDAVSEEVMKKIEELSAYFDSIQIFATRHVDDKIGTTRFVYGAGNWYARFGLASIWIQSQPMTEVQLNNQNENDTDKE